MEAAGKKLCLEYFSLKAKPGRAEKKIERERSVLKILRIDGITNEEIFQGICGSSRLLTLLKRRK